MNLLCVFFHRAVKMLRKTVVEKSQREKKKKNPGNHLAIFTSPLPAGTWLCSKVSCSQSQAEPLENVSLLDPLETSKQDFSPPLKQRWTQRFFFLYLKQHSFYGKFVQKKLN